MRFAALLPLSAAVLLSGCPKKEEPKADVAPAVDASAPAPQAVQLEPAPAIPDRPTHLPEPPAAPAENALSAEKVALGHTLFFDARLSKDDTKSCESCHHPDNAYVSPQPVDTKVGGAANKRNAPTMLNLAYHGNGYYWDGRKPTLEAVVEAAWTGQLGADPAAIAAKLNGNETYKALFQRAFKEDATAKNIPMALASFLRVNWSGNSAWDHYEGGEKEAVNKEVLHGFEVFKKAGCALCHVPPLFSDFDYHNVGIGTDKKPAEQDKGRTDASKDEKDAGKFKTPTLRDIEKSGPYFHDGSVGTLDEAIDLMAAGGKKNKLLDKKLKPAKLSKADKAALKAFLISLTGNYSFGAGPQLPK